MKDYDGQRRRSEEFLRRWRRKKERAKKKAAGPPPASGAPPAAAGPPPPDRTCLLCGRPLREGEGWGVEIANGPSPDQPWPGTERFLGVNCDDCHGLPAKEKFLRLAALAKSGGLDHVLPPAERDRLWRGTWKRGGGGRRRPSHG
jgi:hypothetical protein